MSVINETGEHTVTEQTPKVDIYKDLSEPFAQEMERKINKGGVNLTYIPVSEVINRLNKVLGVDNWSMTVVKCERDQHDPDFVIAHVRLEYNITEFSSVIRDGIGGQKIKRTKQGQILDLGDEFKGAISDALKKAAQALGVGLYLARSEEAMEVEEMIDISKQVVPTQQNAVSSLYDEVKSLFDSLSDESKKAVKAFWAEHSNGVQKPLSKMNEEELNLIRAEVLRLSFGGNFTN